MMNVPSLIAWRRCLEQWTAYGGRNWEGGLTGGLIRWNRLPSPSWYQGRGKKMSGVLEAVLARVLNACFSSPSRFPDKNGERRKKNSAPNLTSLFNSDLFTPIPSPAADGAIHYSVWSFNLKNVFGQKIPIFC